MNIIKIEKRAVNDNHHIKQEEKRLSESNKTKSYEQIYEEAVLKLEYYKKHWEELTKDANAEQLRQLSIELQKIQMVIDVDLLLRQIQKRWKSY